MTCSKSGYRNIRASFTNIELLGSVGKKGDTWDEILSKVISVARPILLKKESTRVSKEKKNEVLVSTTHEHGGSKNDRRKFSG